MQRVTAVPSATSHTQPQLSTMRAEIHKRARKREIREKEKPTIEVEASHARSKGYPQSPYLYQVICMKYLKLGFERCKFNSIHFPNPHPNPRGEVGLPWTMMMLSAIAWLSNPRAISDCLVKHTHKAQRTTRARHHCFCFRAGLTHTRSSPGSLPSPLPDLPRRPAVSRPPQISPQVLVS